jgi:Family of unknown function (DUF6573)
MSGPKLHGVSRTRAIAEGVLFDVSDLAHEAGFRCPLAVTPEALGACFGYGGAFESDGGPYTAEEEACLRDLLKLLRHALIPLDGGSNRVDFVVDVLNETRPEMPPVMQLRVACGLRHGDLPAITVMLPTESDSAYDDRVPETGRLSRCPRCGGEIRAILERHYSLCGGTWVETGSGEELYCENDCDLAECSGRIPELPEVS